MLTKLSYCHHFLPSICSGHSHFIPCHEILGYLYINQLLSPIAMIINYNVVPQKYHVELLNAFWLSSSMDLNQLKTIPFEKRFLELMTGLQHLILVERFLCYLEKHWKMSFHNKRMII